MAPLALASNPELWDRLGHVPRSDRSPSAPKSTSTATAPGGQLMLPHSNLAAGAIVTILTIVIPVGIVVGICRRTGRTT
jgi:hypothetical protein